MQRKYVLNRADPKDEERQEMAWRSFTILTALKLSPNSYERSRLRSSAGTGVGDF